MGVITSTRRLEIAEKLAAHTRSGASTPFSECAVAPYWYEGVTESVTAFSLFLLTAVVFTLLFGILRVDGSCFLRLPDNLASFRALRNFLDPAGPAAVLLARVLLRRLAFLSAFMLVGFVGLTRNFGLLYSLAFYSLKGLLQVLPKTLDHGHMVPSEITVQGEALLKSIAELMAHHSATVSTPMGPVTSTYLFVLTLIALYLPVS
jgi:hypothetical protein